MNAVNPVYILDMKRLWDGQFGSYSLFGKLFFLVLSLFLASNSRDDKLA